MSEERRIIICAHCGSSDVSRDAEAQWDVSLQRWTLKCVQDQGFCNGECGNETTLQEVYLEKDRQ